MRRFISEIISKTLSIPSIDLSQDFYSRERRISKTTMNDHIPNEYLQDHSNTFANCADHIESEAEECYQSEEFEEESSEDKAIHQARKSGRWCQKCSQAFGTVEAYHQHLRTASRHHLCKYCNSLKDYHSSRELRLHWQKRHGSLYCEHCNEGFSSVSDKQNHLNAKHHHCECCKIWFKSPGHLRNHWATSKAHEHTFCKTCKINFVDPAALNIHRLATHETRSNNNDDKKRSKNRNSRKQKGTSSKNYSMPGDKAPPDHYAMLGIPSNSSAEEIIKASRQKRIEVHPDRLMNQQGLTPQDLEAINSLAKNVGFAAEVLSNERSRRKYDLIYQQWY